MKAQNTLPYSETESLSYTDLTPQSFSAACRSKLEELKTQLVRRFTSEFSDVQINLVRQAVDEALALASLTIFPHLLLPTLAEEKVQGIRNWTSHQQAIHQHAAFAFAA
ncbi:MAG: hypothetical protein JWQ71_1315 [Pedosphaera sp.]|nr:hypothetical protein [Pedosphaera sp.]